MSTGKRSRLAAQLYSLTAHLQTAADIPVTLKRVREIGYENVQISGVGPVDPKDLKRMLADAGLRAIGAHIGLNNIRTELSAVVKSLKLWKCRYVAIPWLPWESLKSKADWETLAREFTGYGQTLAAEGIRLQYHNHAFEFHRFEGKTGLDILFEAADPQYLQAEIDTCWVARGGGDPADWCLRMKGRMDQVHLKDTVMLNNQPAFAEVGEGNLNWPAILKACKKAGVKQYIVEQDECPVTGDPFKSLEISLNNLRRMGIS